MIGGTGPARDAPAAPAAPARARRREAVLVAAAVFLIAVLPRVSNARLVLRGGIPEISPFDDLYHAHRMAFSAAHPGRVLGFDPRRGVHGAFCPWPPLYDLAAGVLARVTGAGDAGSLLERVVWLPPLVASAFAAAVASWLALRRGAFAGFLAGAAIAVCVPFLEASRVGDIDHHFLEPPLLFGILAATAFVRKAREARGAVAPALALGAAVAAGLFVQTALLPAAAVAAAFVVLQDRDAVAPRWAAAGGLLLAAGAVAVFGLAQPAGYPRSFWYLGVPQAGALLAAAAACAVSAAALRRGASRLEALAAAIAVSVAVAAAAPGTALALLEGAGFLGSDPWLSTIIEFQPLFYAGWRGLPDALARLGGGAVVFAVLAAAWARTRRTAFPALLAFAAAYLAAAVANRRFLLGAGVLLAAAGATAAGDRLRGPGRSVLAAILIGPSLFAAIPLVARPAGALAPEARAFLRSAAFLDGAAPGARVLAPWSWGHVFEVAGGGRPVVDGFGSSIGATEFGDALGLTLLPNEEHVADFCRREGIRFIALDNPLRRLTVQAQAIGLSPRFFVDTARPGPPRMLPAMRFSFWWRAYFDRGAEIREATRGAPAFRRFRLVYADRQPADAPPRFRGPAVVVWELVESGI